MANECPCRYCVAPKRHPGCAADCPEWKVWHEEKAKRDALIRARREQIEDCFPTNLRKPKRGRYR
jgi:hypothetical protein